MPYCGRVRGKMKALIKLMAGLIIITLDGRIQLDIMPVNVITDIVGYGLIIWGATELVSWSPCFKSCRLHAVLSLIFSLGIRMVTYFEMSHSFVALMYGMTAIFYIYMTYYIMEGLMVKNKMEKITEPNANLKGAWMALAVAEFLYSLCYLADIGTFLEEVGLGGLEAPVRGLVGAVAFALNAFFVIMINQVRGLLYPKKETI